MRVNFGKRLLEEIAPDLPGPVYAVTGPEGKELAALASGLSGTLVVNAGDKNELDALAEWAGGAGTVLAMGNGPLIEAARYVAWRAGSSLVVVPTAVTGEQVVKSDVILREGAGIEVLGNKDAELLAVDYEIVWGGPEEETRAAVGEILSILTAVEDWKAAGEAAGYDSAVAEKAVELLDETMDRADDIFDLTQSGIRQIVNSLVKREELSCSAGTRRPIEGPEHAFVECALATAGKALPRGGLLCLGVILMSELQGRRSRPIKQFLKWVQVDWNPERVGLSGEELALALEALPQFARERGLFYTTLDKREVDRETLQGVIGAMREPLLTSSLRDRRR